MLLLERGERESCSLREVKNVCHENKRGRRVVTQDGEK